MKALSTELKFAVLIDAENVSPKYIKIILDEMSAEGAVTYKRIYGDWTQNQAVSWKSVLLNNAINPIQQYRYTTGKNASDSAMIIDAMDILYAGNVDGFCLASSDSDFTRLAGRLREAGKIVVGMGEEKTPQAFVSACNKFRYLDVLYNSRQPQPQSQPAAHQPAKATAAAPVQEEKEERSGITSLKEIEAVVAELVAKQSDDDGWAFTSGIGAALSKRYPGFDPLNYGYGKLVPFLKSMARFEVQRTSTSDPNVKHIAVRDRRSAK